MEAKKVVALCRMALSALDGPDDHAAEVSAIRADRMSLIELCRQLKDEVAKLKARVTELGREVVSVRNEWIRADADAVSLRAQLEAATKWRPIETAPKDERWILVWCEHGQYVVGWHDDDDIGWWVVDDNKHGPYMLRGSAPTHWLPLPAAPTKETP